MPVASTSPNDWDPADMTDKDLVQTSPYNVNDRPLNEQDPNNRAATSLPLILTLKTNGQVSVTDMTWSKADQHALNLGRNGTISGDRRLEHRVHSTGLEVRSVVWRVSYTRSGRGYRNACRSGSSYNARRRGLDC